MERGGRGNQTGVRPRVFHHRTGPENTLSSGARKGRRQPRGIGVQGWKYWHDKDQTYPRDREKVDSDNEKIGSLAKLLRLGVV